MAKTAAEHVQDGLTHHRAGRATRAERCYAEALALDDNNADAHHLLGVLALQAGRWDAAAPLIEKAIALNDRMPAFHDHLGVVRRNQGRLEEAEAGHRRALELDPDFASAHNNLASTLWQAGRSNEAAAAARLAIGAAPGDPQVTLNAGAVLLAGGDFTAAAEAFAATAEAAPQSIEAYEKLGLACYRAGRLEEAEAAFRRAHDLAPERLDPRRWLIEVLLQRERFAQAVQEAGAFAAEHPDDSRVHSLAGVAHWRAGDIDAARAAFERALEIDERCRQAITGLAVIQASLGETEKAAASYRRALEVDPDDTDAYGNLALLGGDRLDAADAARLADLLGRRSLADDQRAAAAFTLAHYLRQADEGAAAFDLYRTGNLLRRAHLHRQGHVFNAEAHGGFIDARRRVFSRGFFRAREGFGSETDLPVFIVGMPRSGTTLIEQILAAHPKVHGAGELRDIAVMAITRTPEITGGEKRYPECLTDLSPAEALSLAEGHLDRLRSLGGGTSRVIDKMPFNYLHVGLIRLLYPNARIIHCRRDARDIGLSCFTTNFTDVHPWSTDLGELGQYLRAYETLMAHWREVLPDGVMTEVDYETLVTDIEGESRRLIKFLGLRWSAKCLKFHQSKRPVMTASRAQVRQPVYTGAVGRWRAHAAELRPLIDVLEAGVP